MMPITTVKYNTELAEAQETRSQLPSHLAYHLPLLISRHFPFVSHLLKIAEIRYNKIVYEDPIFLGNRTFWEEV